MGKRSTHVSEDEIRRILFNSDLKMASSSRQIETIENEADWCESSERRLFKKILEHKPIGPMRHFHLSQLHILMNNVFEDEDTDFEDLLTTDDLQELYQRKECGSLPGKTNGILTFKPKYKIRPSTDQIMAKLHEMYKLGNIESNEYTPEILEKQNDFFLPDGDFGELCDRKENPKREETRTPTGQRDRKRKSFAAKASMEMDSRGSSPKA